MKRLLNYPYVLLSLTSLFWAGNMVMGRWLRDDLPPVALAYWRWVVALCCLLPLALPHLRSQWPILRANWRPVVLLGVLGIGCYNTFAYLALQQTTATSASMLNSFIPAATIAMAFVFFGKRLTQAETSGVLVSMVGVTLLISHGDIQTLLGLHLNVGDLWMLGAVLVWGLYTVGLQWRPAGVAPMLMLAALMVVGLLVLTPLYAWELASGRHINLNAASLAGILYAGVFPGFVSYVFFNAGIAAVGPARGSLFIHLMPVFVTILSALLLGERPYWYHFVGIGLVFTGIALTTRSKAALSR